MNFIKNNAGLIGVVALIIAIIGVFTPFGQSAVSQFGAVGGKLIEQYDPYVRYNGGINTQLPMKLGANGTSVNQISFGACTIWAPANTIAASSSQQIVCQGGTAGITPIAGISANANCDLVEASSTSVISNGLGIFGVSASSTAGTIVANISNLTGTTYTWSATASSSNQWDYQCFN